MHLETPAGRHDRGAAGLLDDGRASAGEADGHAGAVVDRAVGPGVGEPDAAALQQRFATAPRRQVERGLVDQPARDQAQVDDLGVVLGIDVAEGLAVPGIEGTTERRPAVVFRRARSATRAG